MTTKTEGGAGKKPDPPTWYLEIKNAAEADIVPLKGHILITDRSAAQLCGRDLINATVPLSELAPSFVEHEPENWCGPSGHRAEAAGMMSHTRQTEVRSPLLLAQTSSVHKVVHIVGKVR